MHDMEVLFLDEPTVGMDPIMRRDVLNFVRDKAKDGLTVLFTTQILEEADYLCDRIGIMNNGVISAEGTSASLKNSYGDLRKVSLSGHHLKKYVIQSRVICRNCFNANPCRSEQTED